MAVPVVALAADLLPRVNGRCSYRHFDRFSRPGQLSLPSPKSGQAPPAECHPDLVSASTSIEESSAACCTTAPNRSSGEAAPEHPAAVSASSSARHPVIHRFIVRIPFLFGFIVTGLPPAGVIRCGCPNVPTNRACGAGKSGSGPAGSGGLREVALRTPHRLFNIAALDPRDLSGEGRSPSPPSPQAWGRDSDGRSSSSAPRSSRSPSQNRAERSIILRSSRTFPFRSR